MTGIMQGTPSKLRKCSLTAVKMLCSYYLGRPVRTRGAAGGGGAGRRQQYASSTRRCSDYGGP